MSSEPRIDVDLLTLRFGRQRGRVPPLGALWLAGSLEAAGARWSLLDTEGVADFDAFVLEAFVGLVESRAANLVGLSLFSDAIPLVVAGLRVAALHPEQRVIVGGPGVLGLERELLAACPRVEAVVSGEAETILPQLIATHAGELSHAKVHARRRALPLLANHAPREAAAAGLDALPRPAWEWCAGRGYQVLAFSMMRGCPFACQFCEVDALMGRRVRRSDVKRAVNDLERALQIVGTTHVQLVDDAFMVSPAYVSAFCHELLARGREITFEVFARPNTLSESLLELLAQAGCRRVYVGIDAADDRTLRKVTSGISIEGALRMVHRAAQHVEVAVSTMWGYPGESFEELAAAVRRFRALMDGSHRFPISVEPHLLQPSVSTELFAQFGGDLVLREELTPERGQAGAGAVWELIRADRRLGAAYYRYQTDSFERKQRLVAGLLRSDRRTPALRPALRAPRVSS